MRTPRWRRAWTIFFSERERERVLYEQVTYMKFSQVIYIFLLYLFNHLHARITLVGRNAFCAKLNSNPPKKNMKIVSLVMEEWEKLFLLSSLSFHAVQDTQRIYSIQVIGADSFLFSPPSLPSSLLLLLPSLLSQLKGEIRGRFMKQRRRLGRRTMSS